MQNFHKSDGVRPVLDALALDGGVIVHDMIPPDTLGAFRDDMIRHAAGHRVGTLAEQKSVQKFWGATTKRFTRLAHRSPAFIEILTDPFYLALADAILLPNAPDYWMNTGQMMIIGPGEKSQILHRDAGNWPMMNRPTAAEVTLSCMFAITDFTAELGATRVVPGSHLWPDYDVQATPEQVTQAVMPAGSGMVYTGRVIHGAGANATADQWRFGLHLSYVCGWLTPEEAAPLGLSREQAQLLSPVAQRLLGWRSSRAAEYSTRLWTLDYEDIPVALDGEA